jgi:hypothetical protein
MWEVTAGMIVEQPDIQHTRRFEITSDEWERSSNQTLLFLSRWHEAVAYATQLGLHSASGLAPNWVGIKYIWL